MNLITDPWIPIIRRSGEKEKIAPWQLVETDDPVWALDSPRPDFDGALMQFLIGLFQVLMPPKDESEWIEKLENPPSVEDLKEILFNKKYLYAFDVKGEKGSFMEDFDLEQGSNQDIGQLLIDVPGENALKKNTDHFVKRGTSKKMCSHCAVMALFTLQTNAPSGGVGYRTSLRGGGPLTTLVIMDENSDLPLPKSLWTNVWLNVLSTEEYKEYSMPDDCGKEGLGRVFPWLTATRTSQEGSSTEKTTPSDVHLLQAYWGMPRRIRIDWEYTEAGICDLCHQDSDQLVNEYKTKNYGTNYEGPWEHPLTPHQLKEEKPILRHPQPGGFTYNHWPYLAVNDESNSKLAKVVNRYLACQWQWKDQLRIWIFGYDMDNMKARCWYEAKMPLFHIDDKKRKVDFGKNILSLVKASEGCAKKLEACVKKAWKDSKNKGKGKKDKADTSFIKKAFLDRTESQFYEIAKEFSKEGVNDLEEKRRWGQTLEKVGLKAFDFWVLKCDFTYSDPKRIVKAREQMKKGLNKIKKDLGLLPPQLSKKKSLKRRT